MQIRGRKCLSLSETDKTDDRRSCTYSGITQLTEITLLIRKNNTDIRYLLSYKRLLLYELYGNYTPMKD